MLYISCTCPVEIHLIKNNKFAFMWIIYNTTTTKIAWRWVILQKHLTEKKAYSSPKFCQVTSKFLNWVMQNQCNIPSIIINNMPNASLKFENQIFSYK